MHSSLLTIKNLNHSIGQGALRKQVLFEIGLEIRAGEIVIMTGPSGSGKTTLLTLIGGLRTVQSGSLSFLGQELKGASQRQLVNVRRQIGYIFQAHNLLPFLTAQQNVQLAFELHRKIPDRTARAKAEAMLKQVKLGDRTRHHPQHLSGGQKQRVAIARALATQPQLVLADEPTAALDSQTGREVIELMQTLARDNGTTILLVTHDHRILDVADRIIQMEDGRLLSPKNCVDAPMQTEASIQFLGQTL